MENESYKTISTLSQAEKYLDGRFLKVHKCYIINKDYVKRLIKMGNRSYKIEFRNTDKYAFLSRYKYNVIMDKLGSVFHS